MHSLFKCLIIFLFAWINSYSFSRILVIVPFFFLLYWINKVKINKLPQEILEIVFQSLKKSEALRCKLVCFRWYSLGTQYSFDELLITDDHHLESFLNLKSSFKKHLLNPKDHNCKLIFQNLSTHRLSKYYILHYHDNFTIYEFFATIIWFIWRTHKHQFF